MNPTISISEVTVPSFNEKDWDGIKWWNDRVARQLTSLLSEMIMQTGEVSVRDEDKSEYVLKTEVTSYKEIEEKERRGGVRGKLENLLCPSPGLLKSLAVTGESKSCVDPL